MKSFRYALLSTLMPILSFSILSREILETLLSNTSEVELDRWVVSITKLPLGKKLPKVTKEIFIQVSINIFNTDLSENPGMNLALWYEFA